MVLDGYQKAAIFLTTLGEDAAGEILKNLSDDEIGKITASIRKTRQVDKQTVDQVLQEVWSKAAQGQMFLIGEDFIRKALSKGLGVEGAEKILRSAAQEGPLEDLRKIDPKTMANFLVSEHPQTIALIISMLETKHAADVFSALPDFLRPDVALRMATTERIPESALDELRDVLRTQLEAARVKGRAMGGSKTVAEILNRCDRTVEQTVLERIEEENGKVADSIRQLMFTFDDLITIDNRGMQTVLKETTTEDLAVALKTASEAIKDKIFSNMSQRASQMLKDEIQMKGPVKVADVEKAQQNIIKIARKLEGEGKIVLGGRGDDGLVS